MRTVFVTGTDTDVGKTICSAALIYGLRKSETCHYWKPVQSGFPTDSDFIRKVLGPVGIEKSRFEFSHPVSPDQAADKSGQPQASLASVLQAHGELNVAEYLIVEGAGGVCVPLNDDNETWLDLLTYTQWSTIVVARSGLGTLNHTSLTLKALEQRQIPLLAVVLSGYQHKDNEKSLKRMFPWVQFLSLPYFAEMRFDAAWQQSSEQLASIIQNLRPNHLNHARRNKMKPDNISRDF